GAQAPDIAAGPALVDAKIAAVDPAQAFQFLPECADPALRFGIGFHRSEQNGDATQLPRLPGLAKTRLSGDGHAADQGKKLPPSHAIHPPSKRARARCRIMRLGATSVE